MTAFPLNSLEKFILAHETVDHSFTSNLIVELSHALDKEKLQLATAKLFREIPLLRSKISNGPKPQRIIEELCWFDPLTRLQELESFEDVDVPNIVGHKMDPFTEPPLKITYGKNRAGKYLLVMTVHHISIDGFGQAFLFKEFFHAYQGLPLTSWVKEFKPFQLRTELFHRLGLLSSMKLLFFSFLPMVFGSKPMAETLLTNESALGRQVQFLPFPVPLSDKALRNRAMELGFRSSFELLVYSSVRALQQCTNTERPIVAIVPLNLRLLLGVDGMFQNIVGLCRIVVSRKELTDKSFPTLAARKIRKSITAPRAISTVFLIGIVASVFSFERLRTLAQKIDRRQGKALSTLFVSVGKYPSELDASLGVERIYGYGSLTKSPGLGIILAGEADKRTLVVEYLEDLITKESALQFQKALLKHFLDYPIPEGGPQ